MTVDSNHISLLQEERLNVEDMLVENGGADIDDSNIVNNVITIRYKYVGENTYRFEMTIKEIPDPNGVQRTSNEAKQADEAAQLTARGPGEEHDKAAHPVPSFFSEEDDGSHAVGPHNGNTD